MDNNWRIEYQILDPEGNMFVKGDTYIIPENIDEFGNCPSVDIEIGSKLRYVRNNYKPKE